MHRKRDRLAAAAAAIIPSRNQWTWAFIRVSILALFFSLCSTPCRSFQPLWLASPVKWYEFSLDIFRDCMDDVQMWAQGRFAAQMISHAPTRLALLFFFARLPVCTSDDLFRSGIFRSLQSIVAMVKNRWDGCKWLYRKEKQVYKV
jgi:hypothetical protein